MSDEEDRHVVGKSAGLNDSQIEEIIKLPRGVSAIYQNDWLEPVLCKFNRYDYEPFLIKYNNFKSEDYTTIIKYLLRYQSNIQNGIDKNQLISILNNSEMNENIRTKIKEYMIYEENLSNDKKIHNKELNDTAQEIIASVMKINGRALDSIKLEINKENINDIDICRINKILTAYINQYMKNLDHNEIRLVKEAILKYRFKNIYASWLSLIRKGAIK